MPPVPFEQFLSPGFGAELIYSFVVIVCSLMVYFGTRELYELSSHKGIKYFRLSFLLFAVAFFFRSFIKIILLILNVNIASDFSPRFFGLATLFLFVYFSTIAVFYLLYSIIRKNWNSRSHVIYLFHIIAIVISLLNIIAISLRRDEFLFMVNFFLLLFVSFGILFSRRDSRNNKKIGKLYTIYMLLFVFWILNTIDILLPRFLETFQLVIYLASTAIFLSILYKVLKKIGD